MVIKMRLGRCMSKRELRRLRREMELYDDGSGYVPVFDCPRHVEEKLRGMRRGDLRDYFRRIGVRCADVVVFFEVADSVELLKSSWQKNGLQEYKVPEGTKVEIYDLIRL